MSPSRRVFLDPDGTFPSLLGVIIAYPTGVLYEHQCAGIETDLKSLEGYFVPLGGLRAIAEEGLFDPSRLTEVFHDGDACRWGGRRADPTPSVPHLPQDRLDRFAQAVEAVPYWTHDELGDYRRSHLRLDETRLGELVEAWAPVLTPDGSGVLVWKNCD